MTRKTFSADNMGEPISFEDVISIMTVIFVLFFLFMVPIVNIDKARTVSAQMDPYWQQLAGFLFKAHNSQPKLTAQYLAPLDLYGHHVIINTLDERNTRYIEVISPDTNITVVEHDLDNSQFISMLVQAKGGVIVFRTGTFHWIPEDGEWLTTNEKILYGKNDLSEAMKVRYKAWTLSERGF